MKQSIVTLSLIAASFLLDSPLSHADTVVIPHNYIETVTYLDSTASDAKARRSVTWFDGLGRERQTNVTAGADGYSIRKDYDRRGNLSKTWLPVPAAGYYMTPQQFAGAADDFYGSGETPYSRIVYEESGQNRPSAEYCPGKFWSNHPVRTNHYRNEASGNMSCTMLVVNADGSVSANGTYPPGTLRITETVNEDGMRTLVFENRSGKTVLERRIGSDLTSDTRFIYDIRGDLRYAVAPEGCLLIPSSGSVPAEVLEKQSQRFTYDHLHRVISAAKAGCEPVEYVYGRMGTVILQSTGQQRASSTWEVMKYDSRQRPAMRGLVTLPGKTRAALQSLYGDSLFTVSFTPSAYGLELDMGYTQLSGPAIDVEDIATVWYYDNYDFICDRQSQRIKALFTSSADKPYANNGRLTGSCSNVTGSFRQLTAYRYDGKGNETFRLKWDIFLNSYVHAVRTEYDFVNQPVKITETWQDVSEATVTESHQAVTRLTYDEMGHLTRETLKVDNDSEITLRQLAYDGIGRLISEKSSVNVVDYAYDIRSHITSISSAPYTETAVYELDDDGWESHAFVNSTEDSWGDDYAVKFNYTYDSLGRLTCSWTNDNKMHESYNIDLNSAVTGITRTYNGTVVSDAIKQFDGMKPISVYEVSFPYFIDAVGRINPGDHTMTYDRNGRLTKDTSRGVSAISYNRFVDRPAKISFDNGNFITSSYAPDGTLESRIHTFRKLVTTVKVNSKGDTIVTTANRSVSEGSYYYGNFEKTVGKLRYNTSTGYYDMDNSAYYRYLRNRQGSVMAVVDSEGNTVQRTGLYPTGTPYILPCDYRSDATNDLTPATDRLHIGNHWLGQSGLNYYDNTARLLDPILGDFKSGDPQFAKYPSMSHYSFCGANFANLIDPTGEDIFLFDIRGNLIQIYETEEEQIRVVDEGGDPASAACLKLDGQAILKHTENVDGNKYDLLRISTDEKGMSIFKFLSDFTDVEWTLVQTTEIGAEINYLTTSHDENMEAGGSIMLKKGDFKPGSIRNHIHNHPGGTTTPTGLYKYIEYKGGYLSGDIETAQEFNAYNKVPVNFSIYASGQVIPYSPSGMEYSRYNLMHMMRNANANEYLKRLFY